MNDRELKSFIGRLTGVKLVPVMVRSAMADVPGVPHIAERDMQWQRYEGGGLAEVPQAMKGEFERLFSNFSSQFASSGGQEGSGEKMVYAYYAADPILNQQQMQAISGNADMMQLVEFMTNHGLRLWKSPSGMHRWSAKNRKPYNPAATNGGVGADGRDKYFENFGYAWGAKKVAVNRNVRQAPFMSQEHGEAVFGDQVKQYEMELQGKRVAQVVTAQKNGAWGIFFQDPYGKLYSPISDKYYHFSKTSEDTPGFVDRDAFVQHKGQHIRFYGFPDQNSPRGKVLALPTQAQFQLPDGPDGTPVPVRRGSLGGVGRGDRYYLWIKNDGTLWWLQADQRGAHLKGGASEMLPLTEDQVHFVNIHEGEYVEISNPDVDIYDWNTVPEEVRPQLQQDYEQKTNLMNQMYDTLAQSGMEPYVALNAFKYVIVGPSSQSGTNVDKKKTRGQMVHPNTIIEDQGAGLVVRREDWVRIAGEYNVGRAEKAGTHGYGIGQAMSGKGAHDADKTLREALVKAFKQWNINAPFPSDEEINAAQMLFDKIHYPELVGQDQPNEVPGVPNDMAAELMGDEAPVAGQPAPEQPVVTPGQPAAPQPPVAGQPAPVDPNAAPQQPGKPRVWNNQFNTLADSQNSFLKTSSDVLKKLRKL